MAEKDLPSSSDESDEDFVPEKEINESLSEESNSGDNEEHEDETGKKKKRKNRKRRKADDGEDKQEEEEPVAKKKEVDIDALWADFKQDVNQQKLGTTTSSDNVTKNLEESKKTDENNSSVKKPPARSIPSFSNKNAAGKGLASVLNKLGKKDKLSTLEKSKLDWNRFKQSEGIDEEIKTFNRGKDGYLEKQDFLQRTDLRQFEIEKQLRTKKSFR